MKALQPPPRSVVAYPERTRILIESRKVKLSWLAMIAVVVIAAVAAVVHPWAPFAVLAAAVALAAVWTWPKDVYLLFLILVPFSVEFAVGGGVKMDLPTEALIPVLVLAVLAKGLLRGRLGFLATPLWLPVILFAAFLPVTLAGTRFPLESLKTTIRDWTHIAGGFLLALVLLRERDDLEKLLCRAAIATAVLVVYGLLTQMAQGVAIYQTIAAPFFREHSIYGAYLAFVLALSLGLVFSGYARSPWVRFGFIPLLLLGLALSFVRGAWLSLGVSGLIILLVYRKRVPLSVAVASAIAVAILLVAALSLGIGELFVQRLQHFADPAYVTNMDRLDRWGSAIAIWREHPVLGTGWGTYAEEYFDHVFLRRAFSTGQRMGAHNLYLEILADGGIVTLLLYLSVVGVFFLEARRVFRKARGDRLAKGLCVAAAAAVSGHLLHAFVNNLGPSDTMAVLFWFTLALVPLAEHLWENRPQPDG